MGAGDVWAVTKQTVRDGLDDKVTRLAAALSFYTMLSLGPLLLLLITIAGLLIGTQSAQDQVVSQVKEMMGSNVAGTVETVISQKGSTTGGIIGVVFGFALLVFGATGIVSQLQEALDKVWEVEKPGGLKAAVISRAKGLLVIILAGVLLLAVTISSAFITAAGDWVSGYFGGSRLIPWVIDVFVSLLLIMPLFALLFRALPDVKIAWEDVWVGAAVTAVLFIVGKYLISIYMGYSSTGSTYGAAGSLVALLIWVYYSAIIFLFGAEFTKVYTHHTGKEIVPEEGARRLEPTVC